LAEESTKIIIINFLYTFDPLYSSFALSLLPCLFARVLLLGEIDSRFYLPRQNANRYTREVVIVSLVLLLLYMFLPSRAIFQNEKKGAPS
jgi:hypothetical protein